MVAIMIIIIFNAIKSQIIYFDTMNIGNGVDVMLGDAPLAVAHTYKYLGHIIANNLSDESDMEEKVGCMYARSNALSR